MKLTDEIETGKPKTFRRIYRVADRVWWFFSGNDFIAPLWIGSESRAVDRIYGHDRVALRPDKEACNTIHVGLEQFAILVARKMAGSVYQCGRCSWLSTADWRFCGKCGCESGSDHRG